MYRTYTNLGTIGIFALLIAAADCCAQQEQRHKETNMKFACALECMDGRPKEAATKHIQKEYEVDFVDSVTEPGMVRILADNLDDAKVAEIRSKLAISVNRHGSKIAAIVAHPNCAGNPVEKRIQIKELWAAKRTVESFGFKIKVILLWVEEDWKTVEDLQLALTAR